MESNDEGVNYGPLQALIGTWYGDKGVDISPEPDDTERNPYYETIVFSEVGDVENAEAEQLIAIHYHQLVSRKSNDKVFHNQTGYWMWNPQTDEIMHSIAIPRGVCVLASGSVQHTDNGAVIIEVSTEGEFPAIAESRFMHQNARTLSFSMQLQLLNGELSYRQTTQLEIYGREFEHKDLNRLRIQ